jgi:hypothetical protein
MENLQSHLTRIRRLRTQGANAEFAAMQATTQLEQLPILWKTSRSDTFDDFLKRERLCTPSRYKAFKNAVAKLGESTVKNMGVQAACLLARQAPQTVRQHTGTILAFSHVYGVGPTYQYVSKLIGVQRKRSSSSIRDLKLYIAALEQEVRRLGGQLPKAA